MTDQIQAYQDAIEAKIRARFPIFNTVAAYPQERLQGEITLPAFLYEISELEAAPGSDGGTEQAPIDVRIEAHLLFSFKTPNIKRMLPALAADVLAFAKINRWGVRCEPCETLGAYPGSFDADLEQYAVWRVEWHQVLDIGVNVWANDPLAHPPIQVFIGEHVPMGDDTPGAPHPIGVLPLPYEPSDPRLLAIQDNTLLHWLE